MCVTRSDKRGLKSLGPIRATGKEARDNHYNVLRLIVLLRLTRTVLSLEIRTASILTPH